MKGNKGFTLIELLVVIAIIGLLSSIVLASLNSARMKARDTRRIADFRNVSLAMNLYYDKYNAYPPSPNLCCGGGAHNQNFESMTAVLVSEGFLPSVPKAPSASNPYMHYKYGAGSPAGALLVTDLEGIDATTVGPFGSCRPFTTNWCSSTNASKAYCLCHP